MPVLNLVKATAKKEKKKVVKKKVKKGKAKTTSKKKRPKRKRARGLGENGSELSWVVAIHVLAFVLD